MSDRLAELRRQRELVQQHLAWLDREIAAETTKYDPAKQSLAQAAAQIAAAVASAAPKTTSSPASTNSATTSGASTASALAASASAAPGVATNAHTDADRILDEYRVSPTSVHRDVRKGCFLYFAAALALVGAIVAILYLALSHR